MVRSLVSMRSSFKEERFVASISVALRIKAELDLVSGTAKTSSLAC